jgi:large subunit ribosomal protein L9
MAASIQIVLRDSVRNVGQAGEVVRVKPGFARNYLIPRGLAALASEGNLARVEHERSLAQKRAAKLQQTLQQTADQIASLTVEIQKTAGEMDRLYGSVTSKDVADALVALGVDVDKKKIVFHDTIRNLGTYECSVRLGGAVTPTFKLIVSKKEAS